MVVPSYHLLRVLFNLYKLRERRWHFRGRSNLAPYREASGSGSLRSLLPEWARPPLGLSVGFRGRALFWPARAAGRLATGTMTGTRTTRRTRRATAAPTWTTTPPPTRRRPPIRRAAAPWGSPARRRARQRCTRSAATKSSPPSPKGTTCAECAATGCAIRLSLHSVSDSERSRREDLEVRVFPYDASYW